MEKYDWEERKAHIPFWRHAVAGSLAGVSEHVGMYPIDTVKTRMQVGQETGGVCRTMRQIVREPTLSGTVPRGLPALYRGVSVVSFGCVPAHIALFSTYELLQAHIQEDDGKAPLRAAFCGVAGAFVHDFFMVPSDVVKQRLQLGAYRGPMDCLLRIIHLEGVAALYRSYPVTLAMNAPYTGVLVAMNESLKLTFSGVNESQSVPFAWFFLFGGISGVIAGIFTLPLDVVKTRLQTQGILSQQHSGATLYAGVMDTAGKILQESGGRGFLRGWLPRIIQAGPSAAICWGTYETVRQLLTGMCDTPNQEVQVSEQVSSMIVPTSRCDRRMKDEPKYEWHVWEESGKRGFLHSNDLSRFATTTRVDAHGFIAGPDSNRGAGQRDALDWEEWDAASIPFWKHAMAGSMAGVMEHVAMYPVDTVKTRMQAVQAGSAVPNVRTAFRQITMGDGGMPNLFRGCTVIGAACIPAHIGLFATYEVGKASLLNEKEHTPLRAAFCGAAATVVHDTIIVPMDVIKQRMQLGCYTSALDCVLHVSRNEGSAGFFRSLPSTLLMECPFYAVLVAANESLKVSLNINSDNQNTVSIWWHFATAGVSGIMASAATQPLDVIKTRLQTQQVLRTGCESQVKYHGLFSTATSMWREEGPRSFFRGTIPRMAFAAPSAAMCWGTYEAVKQVLAPL